MRLMKFGNRVIRENIECIGDVINFLDEGIEVIYKDDEYNNTVGKIIEFLKEKEL